MNSVNEKEHEDKLRYMHFARYTLIRVISFSFFLININWLFINLKINFLFGMLLSLGFTVFSLAAIVEQLSRLKIRKNDLPLTRKFFYSESILNAFLVLCLKTPIGKWMLPFLMHTSDFDIMLGLLSIEIIACLIAVFRLFKINRGKDRYLKVIKILEKEK
ncbi:hypothetical protein EFR95_05250 [Lactobacillus amylovorus]|uniref:hypothetical protein n=1 Tax=Lactobacillus amylovorus TaxID=1604 RepID=UPI0021A83881|nr:hypothetical protein [Lactobacillus amylovorus]MCT3585755.1 hypothetical protein [Lactobacillus amylovorus]